MKLNVNLSVVNRPKCNSETYFDLDSHADTCVLGSNALGLVESAHPERTTDVSFAEPSVGTQIKKILSSKLVHTYVDRDSLLDELFCSYVEIRYGVTSENLNAHVGRSTYGRAR